MTEYCSVCSSRLVDNFSCALCEIRQRFPALEISRQNSLDTAYLERNMWILHIRSSDANWAPVETTSRRVGTLQEVKKWAEASWPGKNIMYSLSEDDARQAAASKNQVVLGSLFGWRAFSLREGKITSPVRHESWRTRQRKAKCATSNPCIIVDEKGRTRLAAPGPGCGCGLYLYNTAQSLRFNESQYFTGACASTFATDLRAFVSGWGRAIQHQYGFRCQWLRIEAVLLPSYDLSSQVDLDKVSRRYPGLLFGSYEDWEKWPSYDYPASLRIIPKSEVPEDSLASFTLPKSRPDSQAATHQNWGTRQGTAWIQYGVYSQPGQYVGKTVAQLRQEFSALWMIPANAVAYLGQAKLSENYVVKFGDHIQFHRRV